MSRVIVGLCALLAAPAHAAFPTLESVTESSAGSVADGSCPVDMPATVDADDLLVILYAHRGSGPITAPSGWTRFDGSDSNDNVESSIFAKVAAGSEDGTTVDVDTTFGANRNCAAHTLRITGWQGSIAGVEVSTLAASAGTSGTPNSLSPSWGLADTLWIAVVALTPDDEPITGYPANYVGGTDTISGGGAADGATVGHATRENATATEDPGNFSWANSENFNVYTIGIRPSASSVAAIVHHRGRRQ